MNDGFNFFGSPSRRLPIYLLIDVSESMVGEPLQALRQGIEALLTDLRNDPEAVEVAHLAFITFAGRARLTMPLRELLKVRPPDLTVGPGTSLGAAFETLALSWQRDVRRRTETQRGDFRPLVFLMTDGAPTDDWRKGWAAFRQVAGHAADDVVTLACGEDADLALLREITPKVLLLRHMSPGGFREFFRLVSASISATSRSLGGGRALPPPPAAILETIGTVLPPRSERPAQQIFAVRCRDKGQGYLMRYRLEADQGRYVAADAHPVGDDYFTEMGIGVSGAAIDASRLSGAPACPYCGRAGWRLNAAKTGLECHERVEVGGKQAQVMFVLDVTGSMAGEIDGVRENIADFVDHIRHEGLAVEVGLIAFRDLQLNEPPQVLTFGDSPFTTDEAQFKASVMALTATGGGSNPGESSFDALALACRQPFNSDAGRILVLITDEPPLLPDGPIHSVGDVVAHLREATIDRLYIVTPTALYGNYRMLHAAIAGEHFDLSPSGRGGASFRQLLLDIGRKITLIPRLG